MRLFILILLVLSCTVASAQDSLKRNTVIASGTLSSKNLWRGNVYGDNTPSISGTLALNFKESFEIGLCGTSPINGTKKGYGIWMEVYATKTFGNFSITLDDYFFFNEADSLNDYFNWSRTSTQHLVEARLKYSVDRFSVMLSHVPYASETSVNSLYFETEVFLIKKIFSISAGAVIGESYLNFYDAPGITHVGFTGYKDVVVTESFTVPFKVGVFASPNYKNASQIPGFGQNPINFVVSLTL